MVSPHRRSTVATATMVPVPKVVLVHAQKHLLNLLVSKFEVAGFEVASATTADEGLALTERESPDLIVVEDRLRDRNGTTLSARLSSARLSDKVPIILLTLSADQDAVQDRGVSQLQMPFRPSRLVELALETL